MAITWSAPFRHFCFIIVKLQFFCVVTFNVITMQEIVIERKTEIDVLLMAFAEPSPLCFQDLSSCSMLVQSSTFSLGVSKKKMFSSHNWPIFKLLTIAALIILQLYTDISALTYPCKDRVGQLYFTIYRFSCNFS